MAAIDPAVQSRLIRDLEPIVGKELDRHLAVQKIGIRTNMCLGVKERIFQVR